MLFNLLIFYLLIFYFQPGNRVPVLGAVRLEFLVGLAILVIVFLRGRKQLMTRTRLNTAIWLFFGGLCLSFLGAFFTHTASDAFSALIGMIKSFAVYPMIVVAVDSEKKLKKFLIVYAACTVWLFFEPFYLSLQGLNFQYKGGVTHLYGVGQFAHYNGLGINSIFGILILIHLFRLFKNPILRISFIGLMIVAARVLILTGSRSSWVAFVGFLVITAVVSKHRIRNMLFIGVCLVVTFVMMPTEYKGRLYTLTKTTQVVTGEAEEGSISKRWHIIQDAWAIFLDYPIVGCGVDTFRIVRGYRFDRWQQTHNLYLQILTNAGIVGMICFLFFIRTMLAEVNRVRKRLVRCISENAHFLSVVISYVQLYLLTFLTFGLFSHCLYMNHWWIMAGLTYVCLRFSSVNQEVEASASRAAVSGRRM